MRTVEYNGNTVEIELYRICRDRTKEYDVRLIKGEWPTDEDLVTMCDGGDPRRPWCEQLHRGGRVILEKDNFAMVIVEV